MTAGLTPQVYEHDGAVYADSRQVAEAFGKRHDNVLRDIAKLLENNASSNLRWLNPAAYVDAQGKERPFYELTKDGFTLLAMGFTGEKAAS